MNIHEGKVITPVYLGIQLFKVCVDALFYNLQNYSFLMPLLNDQAVCNAFS